jgi:predicted DNA-binding transcriptional regulator YafY
LFPIVVDDRTKPYGWRWADGADALDAAFTRGANTPRLEVSLRVRRDDIASVLERLRIGSRRVVDDSNGSDRVTVIASVEDTRCFRRRLFGVAAEVEVMGPPSLREELIAYSRRVLLLHER